MRGRKLRNLLSALRIIEDPSNLSEEDLGNGWFLPYLAEAGDRYQALASVDTVVMFQSDAFVTRFADPKMGWSDVGNDRLSVYRIPGWHVDMLQDKGAALIAEHLRPLLDGVDAERDCAVTAAP
jgi:thioesterase domain-containing protein